jgi:hypothetical protein
MRIIICTGHFSCIAQRLTCLLYPVTGAQGCLLYLLRGHELELLLSVGRLLVASGVAVSEDLAPYLDAALTYLAQRALALSLPHVALDLARAHSQVPCLGRSCQVWEVLVLDHADAPPLSSAVLKPLPGSNHIARHGPVQYSLMHL